MGQFWVYQLGAAIGGIVLLFKKSQSYMIYGDATNGKHFKRSQMEIDLNNLHMLCKLNFDLLVPFLCCFEVALEKMQAFFLSLKGNNKINDYFTSCIHFFSIGINSIINSAIATAPTAIFKKTALK